MSNVLRVVWRIFSSQKLAVALIALLAALCIVGTVVPQKGDPGYDDWRGASPRLEAAVDRLGLNGVFTSIPFAALVVAVGVTTAACAVSRLGGLRSARAEAGFLRLLVSRQRLLGSAIFHLGIIATLAGGAASALTRFEGRIVVSEGQTLRLEGSSFKGFGKRGTLSDASVPFGVRLEKFRPQFETPWGMPDYASDVAAVVDGKAQKRAAVRVNAPFVHRGVTLYQGTHGFAPRFIYAERKSGRFSNTYVVLDTDLDSDPARYLGSFAVPGTDIAVDVEFFPDAVFEDGKLRTKSPEPRNPAAFVAVRRGGRAVFSGPIGRGRPIEIEKGVALGLGAPKYWSEFTVVKDSGVMLVFIGAWIVVAGLCVRFLPRRRGKAAPDAATSQES